MDRSRKASQRKDAPAYRYSVNPDHVEEGMLDDPRLQALISLVGMPKDTTKVRVKWSGDQFSPSFKGYEVEFFGIKLASPPDPNQVDCLLSDNMGGYVHVWLYRLRWKGTKAVYEGIWIPGEDSGAWAISIRDLHLVEKGDRRDHCARLLRGSDLVIKASETLKPGRRKGTGYFADKSAFLTALKATLSKLSNPSEPQALRCLSMHELWQGPRLTLAECQTRTKTLRNWLSKCDLTWDKALEEYCKPAIGGE